MSPRPFRSLLVCVLACACGDRAAVPDAAAEAASQVSAPQVYEYPAESLARQPLGRATAELRQLREYFPAPARVAYDGERVVHCGTALRGRVVELRAGLGAVVATDDVLAVIESVALGEAQNELLLALRTAAAAGPLAALAKQAWERAERLRSETQGIALAEVQRREADYRQAAAEEQLALAAAESARNALLLYGMTSEAIATLERDGRLQPRQELRSPLAGTVVARDVVLGDLVDADHEALFTIADLSRCWVLAEVPAEHVAGIALGSAATVRPMHGVGAEVVGRVTQIASALDPATHTASVRIAIEDPPPALRAGTFCEARIAVDGVGDGGAHPPVLAVPEVAVQRLEGRTVVFVPVAGSDERFAARSIEVGPARDGFVPVLAGLQPGETVVSDGSFLVKAHALLATAGEDN
ncbi:MAG: efflux RND transporter periplasmic adaptor subunit [Planctomycetes bacterium]|nr:efflux RND transporter periplasmic adaptor subunit [Planctomycetota bacterium]